MSRLAARGKQCTEHAVPAGRTEEMHPSAPAVDTLRDLLHRVLVTEIISHDDRLTLEQIDTAASHLAARYCAAQPTAPAMRCYLTEMKEMVMKVQATLAKCPRRTGS